MSFSDLKDELKTISSVSIKTNEKLSDNSDTPNSEFLANIETDAEHVQQNIKPKLSKNSNKSSPARTEKKEIKWTLETSFICVENLKEPEKIFNDPTGVKSIFYINKTVAFTNENNRLDTLNLHCQSHNFTQLIIKQLHYMYSLVAENLTTENISKNDKTFQFTHKCLEIVRHFTNYSMLFRNEFYELNGLNVLWKFINNDTLLDLYMKINAAQNVTFIHLNRLVRGTLGILFNLSREYDNFSFKWKELNAFEVIFNLSEKIKRINDNQLTVYMLLASIASDDEIDKFEDLRLVIPEIVAIINKCTKCLKSDKNLERVKVQLDGELKEIVRINLSRSWNLVELLYALYHMGVNDSLKHEIYVKYRMSEQLNTIIFYGNQIEMEYSLKLLWQLCFDEQVAQQVLANNELYDRICSLALNSTVSNSKIRSNCKGIMWLLSSHEKSAELVVDTDERKHVMISYNKYSRDLCLTIKSHLETFGVKIWIDIDNIHGSSLESMARAVENSICVLMCMTENYKQSTNCRAEAEYAFQLNKPIIPIIMQKGYKADGW